MTDSDSKPRRPLVLTLVATLLSLVALLNITLGVFGAWDSLEAMQSSAQLSELSDVFFSEHADEFLSSLSFIAIGVVQLVISVGFWRVRRWAWVAAISWQALKLLLDLAVSYFVETAFIPLAFAVLLVFMLNTADVRRAFGVLLKQDEPTVSILNASEVN